MNYIRPFLMPEGGQDIMKTNLKYVRDIKSSVEARGYTIGEAGVFSAENKDGFAPYFPAKVSFIPIVLAIAAGVVLYLALLFNLGGKQQIALWAVFFCRSFGTAVYRPRPVYASAAGFGGSKCFPGAFNECYL